MIKQSMDCPEILMSAHVEGAMKDLRQFMFTNVYLNPEAKAEEKKAIQMITELYQYFCEYPEMMPRHYVVNEGKNDANKEQIVCDYIAGMTDSYSVKVFQEIFIPNSWQI